MNPHIEYFDSHNWGYSVVEFTREDCTDVGYAVDKNTNAPDADHDVRVASRVPESVVTLEDVTDEYRDETGRQAGRRPGPTRPRLGRETPVAVTASGGALQWRSPRRKERSSGGHRVGRDASKPVTVSPGESPR
jgi:hypothetical protein